jgi:hypothetical protein
MSWRSDELVTWLVAQRVEAPDSYNHQLLTEDGSYAEGGVAALAALVREAHRDARERLERLASRSLDPLDPSRPAGQPSFPDDLETTTLQGYLGEVFAGLVAENYLPHGQRWHVPAFLFRGHVSAFQALERARQQGGAVGRTLGRTGDDALAFQIDDDGVITAWLYGEAKCTSDHDSSLIADGHEKLSAPDWVPVDLIQLIEILESKGTPEADAWAESLRVLNFATADTAPPRFDMLVYVCGRSPAQQNRSTWISTTEAHEKYLGGKPLEAVEIHLTDFVATLAAAYPGSP